MCIEQYGCTTQSILLLDCSIIKETPRVDLTRLKMKPIFGYIPISNLLNAAISCWVSIYFYNKYIMFRIN